MNKQKALLLTGVIFLLMISSVAVVPASNAATPPAPVVKVVSATWYAPNSSAQVSPNSSYVPLFVTIEDTYFTANWQNLSISLGSSGFFSYSYVHGPNTTVVDYQNLSFPSPTSGTATVKIVLEQLVNISSSTTSGIYQMSVRDTSNASTTVENVPFQIGVLATPTIGLVNYFMDPPVVYQNEKYISLDLIFANTGLGPYQNFNVSLQSTGFSVLTSEYHIPYFASGSTENLTFLVDALNVTGTQTITVSYGHMISTISTYVHSYGDLGITSSLASLQPGSSKDLEEFNLTNTANVTMYDLEIHLVSPSVISIHVSSSNPLSALTADNVTIGKLSTGQEITITFLVDVSSSAKLETYPAQLIVTWYTNSSPHPTLQAYNFNEKITPTVTQQLQSSLTFTPLNIAILVVIVVLVAALAVVAARGRKIKKQVEKTSRANTPSLEHKDIPAEKKKE